jgi:hypothetical protein
MRECEIVIGCEREYERGRERKGGREREGGKGRERVGERGREGGVGWGERDTGHAAGWMTRRRRPGSGSTTPPPPRVPGPPPPPLLPPSRLRHHPNQWIPPPPSPPLPYSRGACIRNPPSSLSPSLSLIHTRHAHVHTRVRARTHTRPSHGSDTVRSGVATARPLQLGPCGGGSGVGGWGGEGLPAGLWLTTTI